MTTSVPWRTSDRPFVVAEAGVNHNGDPALAAALVDAAAAAGADAVKFQVFRPEELAAPGARLAGYQADNLGPGAHGVDQLGMIGALTLPDDVWPCLAERCSRRGLVFFATAFDRPSLALLRRLGVPLAKIPSGELTNPELLDAVGGTGLPVLCSTGMAGIGEVEAAVEQLRAAGAGELALLHCTSAYPAPAAQANLSAMATMRAAFGVDVGYSDHTAGTAVAIAAAALGAVVIEKHLTLDRTLPGPDHRASLEPGEFAGLVAGVKDAAAAVGDGRKRCAPAETDTRAVARRSVAFAADLPAGTRLEAGHLALLRPGDGLPPAARPHLVGRVLAEGVQRGDLVAPGTLA